MTDETEPIVVSSEKKVTEGPVKQWARALSLLAAIGPIFYIALTLALGLLWVGYDPIGDTQSELGAVDSPYRTLMNVAGFMGIGLCIFAFAGAYGLILRDRWARIVVLALLTIAGAGMIVVGSFPCDSGCVDVTQTGRLHGLFSAPGAIALPLAAMVSSSVFRSDGRFDIRWQMVSFWMGFIALASGPVIQAELLPDWNGLIQRAAMWPPLIWMSAVSVRLHRLASE